MPTRTLSDSLAFSVAKRLYGALGAPKFRFVLADGRSVGAAGEEAVASVHFQDARAVLALAFDPQLAFGDLYSAGRIREQPGHRRTGRECARTAEHVAARDESRTECANAMKHGQPSALPRLS